MKKFHLNVLFFVLSFYCFGAGFMDSFVIYDGWRFVGEQEFSAFHIAMGKRIIPFFVLPLAVLTILTVMMYWFRPSAIPKSWVTMALVAQMVGWISSFAIQIPIQLELDKGKDDALLEKLIVSDWLRVIAWVLYTIVVISMLYRINKSYLTVNHKRVTI